MSNGNAATDIEIHRQGIDLLNDVLQTTIPFETEELDRLSAENWDSVNHLRLVIELEHTLSVALTDEKVVGMDVLQHIETVLRQHGIANIGASPE